METEINSQGQIIEDLIKKYVLNYCILLDIPVEIRRIVIIASGSSYNAGLFGKYFFEEIAQIDCCNSYASEVSNSEFSNFDKSALYIFISQSGNSYDTLRAMEKVKECGAKTLCITNNSSSKMYELADYKFDINAGEENAIAATKTFSASVVMLWLIALKAAQNKHLDISRETENIYLVGNSVKEAINDIDNLDIAAKIISKHSDFSICGCGSMYALSRECALKIKETSYINTSSYPMGEFIHGHFALLNKSKLFLTFVTKESSEQELNLLKKILSTYKTKSIIITDDYEDYNCDILVKFQKGCSKIASIINMIIAVQMLALKVALRLKRNIDKPYGLKKVVENKG